MNIAVIRYVVRCLSLQCARGRSLSAQTHYFPTLSVHLCETEKKRESESVCVCVGVFVSVYNNFHEGQIILAEIFEGKGGGGSWLTKPLDESKVCTHTGISGVITPQCCNLNSCV